MADNAPSVGLIKRLRQRLNKSSGWLGRDITSLFAGPLDEAALEELTDRLLLADVGVEAATAIVEDVKRASRSEHPDGGLGALRTALEHVLTPVESPLAPPAGVRPWLVLVVGVNGTGKTTTIGKLAHRLRQQGLTVLLAAGDTFRAAAVEQLEVWAGRVGAAFVAQKPGADPAAVIFDAYEAARARGIDVVIADTAGRLHNQTGLMEELKKIKRVVGKLDSAAPHEVMLVLDASQGQNALAQADQFNRAVGVTGITLTKLDGTARGGILVAIARKLGVPIRFVGVGESLEDLEPFSAAAFASALVGDNQADS
jgi:fused signal recognition particle receptor